MSTVSAASDVGIAGSERDERGHGKIRRRTVQALGLVLLAVAIVVSVGVRLRDTADSEAVSRSMLTVPVAPASAALMPTAPTDGVLTMVIPPGAAADQKVGGRGYQMPDVIQLTAGDTIILRNDDTAPHMILYAFLMPGETHERTFTTPGSEVYSSGCGVHAASFLNFTTIFVGE
jgi:plastocyanin